MNGTCKNCGKPLPRNATVRRKYCNDVCRVQYNRSESVQSLYSQAMQAISRLGDSKSGDKKKSTEALKELQTAIRWYLYASGDSDELARRELISGRK